MKRLLLLLAVAALSLPATAVAKGPSEATITGPGLGKGITITGPEQEGSPMMDFAEAAGFFTEAFEQQPSMVLSNPPPTDKLGPKYSVEYTVPGPDGGSQTIRQNLYPYAQPYGTTFMAAGQPIFDFETHGGWFTDSRLKGILVAKGLPKTAAEAKAAGSGSSSAGFFSTGKIGVFLLVLFGIGAGAVLMRGHLRGDRT
ncbi:MAG TPA: hypothetical protein VGJ40_07175 [Gaiellaceae bacterium]|jgi:hypothetical protein